MPATDQLAPTSPRHIGQDPDNPAQDLWRPFALHPEQPDHTCVVHRGFHTWRCQDCDATGRLPGSATQAEAGPATSETLTADPHDDMDRFQQEVAALSRTPGAPGAPDSLSSGGVIDTADLLNDVFTFVQRFVVLTEAQYALVALWVAHSHAIEAAEQTPYISVQSPEKQSGKSRLLEVLELLVARPRLWENPSEAVVYRMIERDQPTLLLDEIDAIWSARGDEHEGLRALLNAGNRRGVSVPRCVGPTQTIKEFPVFGAKAIAGIGKPPDTVGDRSIPIVLKRKTKQEKVERLRRRGKAVKEDAPALKSRLAAWAEEHVERLTTAEPDLPDELSDRAQDAVEPLLAIADLAGGGWPIAARNAAVTVIAGASSAEDGSLKLRLLADARRVWVSQGCPDKIKTADLVAGLRDLEESPWGSTVELNPNKLAWLLKDYDIKSKAIRFPDDTTLKGFVIAEGFADAWARYVPDEAPA